MGCPRQLVPISGWLTEWAKIWPIGQIIWRFCSEEGSWGLLRINSGYFDRFGAMPTQCATRSADILQAVRDQTQHLLGLTITYSEADWAFMTRLPGWTRSHVAAHLILGAQELTRIADREAAGESAPQPKSTAERVIAIELGALKSGMELQVELDTSAGLLTEGLTRLSGVSGETVLHSGRRLSFDGLPLLTLAEITIHANDLSSAATWELAPEVTMPLLEFAAEVYPRTEHRPIRLVLDSGEEVIIPGDGEPMMATGPGNALLLWLARGVVSPSMQVTDVDPAT